MRWRLLRGPRGTGTAIATGAADVELRRSAGTCATIPTAPNLAPVAGGSLGLSNLRGIGPLLSNPTKSRGSPWYGGASGFSSVGTRGSSCPLREAWRAVDEMLLQGLWTEKLDMNINEG